MTVSIDSEAPAFGPNMTNSPEHQVSVELIESRGRYAQPQAPPEQSQYLVVDAVRAPGLIGEDVIGELVGCDVVGGDSTSQMISA